MTDLSSGAAAATGAPPFDPVLPGDLVRLRRDLHAHPELRFEGHRRAGIVAERLAGLGHEVHRGLGGTGVVGTLRGEGPGAISRAGAGTPPRRTSRSARSRSAARGWASSGWWRPAAPTP